MRRSEEFDDRVCKGIDGNDSVQLPIAIDNTLLLTEACLLRDNLELYRDYYLVPEEVWRWMTQLPGVFTLDCEIATMLQAE